MTEVLVRYFHFVGIIVLASMLISQNILLSKQVTSKTMRTLAFLDIFYALGAIITLACGLLLWLSVGKSASFYSSNPYFLIKISLFLLVATLSIAPTLFFRMKKSVLNDTIVIPENIIYIKRTEMAFIFILPLLASVMARGIGS